MCEHIKFCKNITFIAHFDGIESRKRLRATSVKQANKFKYDPILTFIALKCYIQLVVCNAEEKKKQNVKLKVWRIDLRVVCVTRGPHIIWTFLISRCSKLIKIRVKRVAKEMLMFMEIRAIFSR